MRVKQDLSCIWFSGLKLIELTCRSFSTKVFMSIAYWEKNKMEKLLLACLYGIYFEIFAQKEALSNNKQKIKILNRHFVGIGHNSEEHNGETCKNSETV